MPGNIMGETAPNSSLRRRFLIFSLILFVVILIGGSTAFVLSMWQIIHISTGNELVKTVEIERIKLEASVNAEIKIALMMANSPVIKRQFLNPANTEIRRVAFDEIEGYRQTFASHIVFWASDIDKEFYFAEDDHYTIDADDPVNYWYKMTLYETEVYNFNINYNPEIAKTMLWINATVFDSAKKPIGLVGTGIDITEFVDSIYKDFTGTSTMYLFNDMGEITGAANTSLVANKVTIPKELGAMGADIMDKAKNLKDNEFVLFNIPGGGNVAISNVPALEWHLVILQPLTIIDALNGGTTVLFIVMMAVIALIFVIVYAFISGLLKPMKYMVQILAQISADWDLTRRLKLHRRDEIGMLGEFFNQTFTRIEDLIKTIKGKTISLSDTGDELNKQMTTTKTDINLINSNIQGMRKQVLTQSDTVNAAAGSMDKIISGLDKLNDNISVQAENVAQSSSAVEEMIANVQSVTQTLIKNTVNISSLGESSDAGREDLQKVSADIQEIARESEGLLEINSVMQNIASQTNLLSMNAAIEAAHAGESGKGFAVVADEIRKLAENSSSQSKTISAVLKKIKVSIDTITKSTGVVLERFGHIENEVKTVSDQETQIRNAMEEQGIGSRSILESITKLNSVTEQVRRASSGMLTESKEVIEESAALKQITTEVAGRMDEMAKSTDEISGIITRVQEISEENKENIDSLKTEIGKFRLE